MQALFWWDPTKKHNSILTKASQSKNACFDWLCALPSPDWSKGNHALFEPHLIGQKESAPGVRLVKLRLSDKAFSGSLNNQRVE